jgi:hypothetical protein
MKPLTAFKLVRMVQDEHRTEADFEGTGAEGGQEMTLILNNINAQEKGRAQPYECMRDPGP